MSPRIARPKSTEQTFREHTIRLLAELATFVLRNDHELRGGGIGLSVEALMQHVRK
jgi:hypothetical protein